jgi:hypothetical protein
VTKAPSITLAAVPTTPARDPASQAPSRLPLLYFSFAHLCLAGALGALAAFPRSFAGFFYHPRMLAVVHLVTLGWITSHILGALYMIAPMALQTRLRATRADTVAFWIYALGVTGMVAHFWIAETSGMLWGALLVIATLVLVGWRTLEALRASPVDAGVKLHYRLAFANLAAAGGLGVLLGVHRLRPFLTAEPLANLFAHAHLAALGWATMTVFGSAHRLLPMMLPSAPPPRSISWVGAVLLEMGVLGMVFCFLTGEGPLALFAVISASSVVWFLGVVAWMLRHRRRPGPGLPRPDLPRLHALQALLYLALATVLGLALAFAPRSGETLRLAKVYAVCGLLGFMGAMILGVGGRHVPLLLWTHRLRREGVLPEVPPYRLRQPALQAIELGAWSVGVPLLAAALWLEAPAPLSIAAGLLLTAVATSAANHVQAWRRARRAPSSSPEE